MNITTKECGKLERFILVGIKKWKMWLWKIVN